MCHLKFCIIVAIYDVQCLALMDGVLHYTSVTHANGLVANVNQLRLGGQLCDVMLISGTHRVRAHRLVLAASSPFFTSSLYQQPSLTYQSDDGEKYVDA